MSVVAYVSGHGFGHSAREVEILRRLPPEIPLVVKTAAPQWFWRQEVARPFTFVGDAFDVGCVQSTSLEVDVAQTLAAWTEMDARNRSRIDAELVDLRERGARLIVSDVASFPLTLAARLGIPGVCVANFTWADIYAGLVNDEPRFKPIADTLATEYAQATLLLDAALSLPMAYFALRETAGLVARPGKSRRDELFRHLSLDSSRRVALVYAGNWGLPLPWTKLETFADWQFVSLAAPPTPVANLFVLPQALLPHPDLVASVDLVISKPGYGLVGECLSASTPLLYCSRQNFAEYAALDAVLRAWPGGLFLDADAFVRADWRRALDAVPVRARVPAVPAEGGQKCAEKIVHIYKQAT